MYTSTKMLPRFFHDCNEAEIIIKNYTKKEDAKWNLETIRKTLSSQDVTS